MKRIVILASGNGSNAEKIIEYFKGNKFIKVVGVLSNKNDAPVLEKAKKHKIASFSFTREEFYDSELILDYLKLNSDYIVLAGFLWKIPKKIIELSPQKIINIHPSLLPKYGGKGMYGDFVHQAVLSNKEKFSGITIHWVDELYDTGKIIFQKKITVNLDDDVPSLANKIHKIEHEWYPKIIEKTIMNGL